MEKPSDGQFKTCNVLLCKYKVRYIEQKSEKGHSTLFWES